MGVLRTLRHSGLHARAGPRQPWHDIHCQVEGPIATDLLVNFVQRFTKQAPDDAHRLLPLPEVRGARCSTLCLACLVSALRA